MPHKWQMRMAGALPVGTDVSASSWCFVKLGSSVEIASPVVVNEKGDSRVSRKCERLALRGSMFSAFGCLSGCAVGVCTCFGSEGGLALSSRRTGRSTPERYEPLTSVSQHFNAGPMKYSRERTQRQLRKV